MCLATKKLQFLAHKILLTFNKDICPRTAALKMPHFSPVICLAVSLSAPSSQMTCQTSSLTYAYSMAVSIQPVHRDIETTSNQLKIQHCIFFMNQLRISGNLIYDQEAGRHIVSIADMRCRISFHVHCYVTTTFLTVGVALTFCRSLGISTLFTGCYLCVTHSEMDYIFYHSKSVSADVAVCVSTLR